MTGSDFDSLVDDDDDESDSTEAEEGHQPETKPTPDQATGAQVHSTPSKETSRSSTQDESLSADVRLEDSNPAFPFDSQNQIYAREQTWLNYDDFKHSVQSYLREDHNLRNVQGRELDEVILRLALEELSREDVGDMIIRLRGYNPENVD